MKVETYEVEEIQNELGQMAADSEAQELIEKLGLEGQRSLLNPETCTRFPYRKMTKAEHKVFSVLFPQRADLSKFNDGIIPIRVLQVAAFVKEFEGAPCPWLKVWHCQSAKEDPLLVGHTSEWGGEFYLLARWGDALLTVEQLTEKAVALWKVKAQAKLAALIQKVKADMENLDGIAMEIMGTGEAKSAQNQYDLETME